MHYRYVIELEFLIWNGRATKLKFYLIQNFLQQVSQPFKEHNGIFREFCSKRVVFSFSWNVDGKFFTNLFYTNPLFLLEYGIFL